MRYLRNLWRRITNCCRKKHEPVVVTPDPIELEDERTPAPNDKVPTARDKRRRTKLYYEYYYRTMEIKNIEVVERIAQNIKNHKSRYLAAQLLTGVDWRIIGVIHNLEAGGSFARQILNGERWKKRTRLVPKGEGPWRSWEESCVTAFKYHKLESNSVGAVLKFLERYNGLGYVKRGINSPYIWSYTNHYTSGKYVSDGKYSSYAVSKQAGAAPTLKLLGF
jgi:lysozyme family protein